MSLKRSSTNSVLGGVCGGLAEHLQIDPVLIRLGFVLGFLFWGIGPLIYLVLWIIMAKE